MKIGKRAMEHWIHVEAIISREGAPDKPVADGLVPDPPAFTACVSYLRSQMGKAGGAASAAVSRAKLKGECEARDRQTRGHVLVLLTTFQWLKAESERRGISVSETEVVRRFEQFIKGQFSSDAAFRRSLTYSGETLADEYLVMRSDMLATKLGKYILARYGKVAAVRFWQQFPERWASRTSCSAPYIGPNCKEYQGPEHPEVAL